MTRCQIDEFVFDVALHKTVFHLECRDRFPPQKKLRNGLSAYGIPRRCNGKCDMTHLSISDEVIKGSHHFFGAD